MNIPAEKFPEDTDKPPEVSIVMSAVKGAYTLAACIATAARAFSKHRIAGQIIVADNVSTNGSQDIAEWRTRTPGSSTCASELR